MSVSLRREGMVAHVRLERPEVRNAQSLPLLRALDHALTTAAYEPDVRVVVLSGAGPAFSAGHDIRSEEQRSAQAAWRAERRPQTDPELHTELAHEHFVATSLRWRELPVPTIAAVHGWCLYGGWMLASAMDLVVASDDLRLMTTLLQYFTLPYDVGVRQAKDLLFDRRELTADEALAMGLVNRVVPRARLDDEVAALAARIAEHDPFLMRQSKRAIHAVQDAAGFQAAVAASHAQYQVYESHLRALYARHAAEHPGAAPPSLLTGVRDRDEVPP